MNTTFEAIEELAKTVRQLAAEYPDFTYVPPVQLRDQSRCTYNTGGCDLYPELCGCIVGQAVRKLGIDIPANMNLMGLEPILLLLPGVTLPELRTEANVIKLVDWLQALQAYQDSQKSWANAVVFADAWQERTKHLQE